ncbi:DUF4159 domain-containing protein [Fulvimarina sp. 2208YS6-2-32]|uniref:DUF4159 domain-containing protein n=1 Tax=Fulvimarina uroteuthidis TaxID=3098149 RepID=A0ABU5I4E8_9HYPH|nr:DUF4159 domain-containing protein [Fulvimarina sp. 2208YS6-2-32]MDY8110081.1 DUF4159 domain-containing protein [Fulvimarina sp. 2208YS6-2-32]
MPGLSLSFGAPLVLAGLLALPVIWWLLKLTPPRPQTEAFPPLRILQRVLKSEETPSKSPWWLTLLRLILAALVIFALAAPSLNPRETLISGSGPVAVMIDNGWASARGWDETVASANALISQAGDTNRPVSLVLTADGPDNDARPVEATTALERLGAAAPRPIPVDRAAAAARLSSALEDGQLGSFAFLSDGLDAAASDAAAEIAARLGADETLIYKPSIEALTALTAADNSTDALVVDAIRPSGRATGYQADLLAVDSQGREISRTQLGFDVGETSAQARFEIPVELRNDIARLQVDNTANAAEVRLVDDSFRRRRVALVSGEAADLAQPLLSPLYYISRALEPYADIVRAQSADLSVAIPALLEQRPSVVVLADIGVLPEGAREALETFVENGGYLLRFAGPRLAATAGDDTLVPVNLRQGERQLGGAMSWSEPQSVAPMDAGSPFAGIAVPDDVSVARQVLAEPSVELADRTWASLSDGTPLVTAETIGAGTIVLFHVTAEATWSNLPISGAFVDMLRRIVSLSRADGGAPAEAATAAASLPPYRVLSAEGRLVAPGPDVEPIEAGAEIVVDAAHPPGLYGTEDGYRALNLFSTGATLAPLPDLEWGGNSSEMQYESGETVDLAPWLLAAALFLFALDALALLWLNGGLARLRARFSGRGETALPMLAAALVGGTLIVASMTTGAHAQDGQDAPANEEAQSAAPPRDLEDMQRAIEATQTTRLAFVETGDASVDDLSQAGLSGLSQFIAAKTALEPGSPMGVDIETDELAFYPLIYWPIDPTTPMPSDAAISRIDAYMKQGGTVLFDVADEAMAGLSGGNASAGQMRLREIVGDLDIPPLEPVPTDHVLTKSFYILDDFVGRYADSELWVESLVEGPEGEMRPARGGDGVSSIMITSNDFASAWAVDDAGLFLYPTGASDPMQREYAYRAGVNIVMYVLTGNYKADQVHVPALLERLGQ